MNIFFKQKALFDKHVPYLIGVLIFAIVPFITRLHIWIIVWCIIFWGYAFFGVRKSWNKPGKLALRLLTVFGIFGAAISSGRTFGGDAFVGLLAIMAGLKPLEINSHRDRMITIFLAYFIVIAGLFYSESLSMTIYMIISVLLTTSVLIHINHLTGQMRANLRLSAKIMVQAAPIVVILFFLFPRIQGSFWGMKSSRTSSTGFSDTLSPGSISRLVYSNDIAFRAYFKDRVPGPKFLYWRGIVFEYFDGITWSPSKKSPASLLIKGEHPVIYTVSIENVPDNHCLFVLDMPASLPDRPGLYMLNDYTLRSRIVPEKNFRYKMKSYTVYNTGQIQTWIQRALQIPAGSNPKSIALAQKWADESNDVEKIVSTGLAFFTENPFYYTLNPPTLKGDMVDDFLFRTRKGYCEHYASAFAFLMRAAGVPARIVGGYIGGEINPYGDYLIVRQSDAHVWVEVWIEEKGWVRVDPVAAVAPGRIEGGLQAALSADELPGFLSLKYLGSFSGLWKQVSFGWDAVNNYWDIWFAGYSFEEQETLLSILGISTDSWKAKAKVIIISIFLIFSFAGVILIRMFRKSSAKKDQIYQVYVKFCNKLEKLGVQRKPAQGPADFAQAACSQMPERQDKINEIINLYIMLRYSRSGKTGFNLKKFKRIIREF